ncbi:MAG: glutaredoxin family protein [Xanthomonadales bacterium]|jgi:hypothetical protein|nr:glutaredoxin family protein [Xanthomonadales bacterium]MDH3924721.1 glutaredoxin family protein [Xanthomonadales bacterium]MDH3940713.1 glutaredoxin family protein [Xanthomonadales bacterium]MDH4001279.1 glutaredoxin family protein [Xanthomonadales bacterium]
MTVNEPLILYSRPECHLCDLAAEMLNSAGLPWRSVDIDADPCLATRYGVHVPVISRPGDGRELFFPFDQQALVAFAAAD